MNLIENFQDLMARLPELLQPLVVALAGAVPFIEGEGAAAIGIVGGIHPAIAMTAAAVGNFASVAVIVLLTSRARVAVVTRYRGRARARVAAGHPSQGGSVQLDEPRTPRQEKFARAFQRYGLPGVSLLGPLLLPTQFTATMLAGAGVNRTHILVWQAIAIVLWTTVIGAFVGGVLHFAN
ncbi:small multidrug efflux protein [Protaetiibacter sp. SSC-01]|uniref:small multidrug efflux protein n=1 Tax=Protaetiibacter sp. SSC-01 TaxID=2759943 RepID=UPI00165712D0|nr:small multidrug efflux protein [Protaetiibacter sp. SSC-01]QNO37335.1 small multidrug efflux protein [Protaetiibacter sp. SSC-01]